MALSIRDPETDRLARKVAELTGETLTEAIGQALEERLQRLERERGHGKRKAEILALSLRFREHFSGRVVPDEEIYGEDGAPRS